MAPPKSSSVCSPPGQGKGSGFSCPVIYFPVVCTSLFRCQWVVLRHQHSLDNQHPALGFASSTFLPKLQDAAVPHNSPTAAWHPHHLPKPEHCPWQSRSLSHPGPFPPEIVVNWGVITWQMWGTELFEAMSRKSLADNTAWFKFEPI